MKNKLNLRLREFMNDPLSRGVLIGSAIGASACVVTLKLFGANFSDPATTLNIPDDLVKHIVETGMPAMITRHDGVQLMIGPS